MLVGEAAPRLGREGKGITSNMINSFPSYKEKKRNRGLHPYLPRKEDKKAKRIRTDLSDENHSLNRF